MKSHQVFISHASSELSLAEEIVGRLEDEGISCWIAPRDIDTGADYGSEVLSGVSKCAVFILLCSEASNTSKHCIRELELALKYDRMIVPLRLDESSPSGGMEYRLSTVQWLDLDDFKLSKKSITLISSIIRQAETRDSPKKAAEYIFLENCVRCGSRYNEHQPSGCSFHSEVPKVIGCTDGSRHFTDIWEFPCCGQKYVGVPGSDRKPPISPGCTNGKHVPPTQ